MTVQAARWMLACAMAKYSEGSRILRVYGPTLDAENRKKIEDTRDNFRKVISATTNRLVGEVQA